MRGMGWVALRPTQVTTAATIATTNGSDQNAAPETSTPRRVLHLTAPREAVPVLLSKDRKAEPVAARPA